MAKSIRSPVNSLDQPCRARLTRRIALLLCGAAAILSILGCAQEKTESPKHGEVVWKTKATIPANAGLSLGVDVVYAVEAYGNSTNLLALAKSSGRQLWKQPIAFGSWCWSPVVDEQRIYLTCTDGHVSALERRSGNPLWKRRVGNMITSSPAVEGGRLFVSSWDGAVYSLSAKTGVNRWRFIAKKKPQDGRLSELVSSPVVSNGTLFVSSFWGEGGRQKKDVRRLWAIDTKTGLLDWHIPIGKSGTRPIVTNKHIYLVSRPSKGSRGVASQVSSLSRKNGMAIWAIAGADTSADYNTTGLVVSGGLLFFRTNSGRLQAVDALTGHRRWSSTKLFALPDPIIVGSTLYSRCTDGICASDSQTGRMLWSEPIEGVPSSLAADGQQIYITTGTEVIALAR